jgi:hypothetical protein
VAEVARTAPNTIAKPEITFAMIELADSADCNSRRSGWRNYGFKDITPMFSRKSSVPSMNGANISSGREMLQKTAAVNADWYMVSGHHGLLYGSDYDRYKKPDGKPDLVATFDNQEYCGFFNEAYHEGRWDHSTRDDPDDASTAPKKPPEKPDQDRAKHHADEIYLRTTGNAPDDIAKHVQVNPLIDGDGAVIFPRMGRCKGIILSACNTLIYRATRIMWSTLFPNAVIIGNFARIASGTRTTNAIAGADMTDENFWRNPSAILDQDGMCEKLAIQMMKGFLGGDGATGISLIYKNTFYVPRRPRNTGKIDIKAGPIGESAHFFAKK